MIRRCRGLSSCTSTAPLTASLFARSAASLCATRRWNVSSSAAAAAAAASSSTAMDAATLAELQALSEVTVAATSTAAAAASKSAMAAAAAAAPPAVEMPLLVRGVDTVLNGIYNAVAWLVPDVTPLLDLGVSALVAAHVSVGLSWTAVLFGFGICVRLSTLYFTLYGERASLRMQVALPELKQAYHRFELAYYDPSATTKEVMEVSTKLKEQQAAVYAKHGTSNKKASAALLGGPVFVYGFWVAMRTTGTAADIHATSWAWLPSLALPDPFMVLPLTVVGLTVVNYELLFAKKGGSAGTGISSSVVFGIRVAALSCLWVISNFRAGVLLYWAGVSLTGLLQPLLMRQRWFQKAFGVPSDEQVQAAVLEASQIAARATQATVGGKSPTQAFMDKLKEQRVQAQSRVGLPQAQAQQAAQQSASTTTTTTTTTAQPEPKSSSPLTYKVTSAATGQTIASGAAAFAASSSAGADASSTSSTVTTAAAATPPKKSAGYFAPRPGGVAYRILHESDLEKKQKAEQAAQETDPLMQRFMFAMPSLSQGVANPQKQQQLAEEIKQHNEKLAQDAQKLEQAARSKSWKAPGGAGVDK